MPNKYKTSAATRLSNLACMAACSRSGCSRPAGKSMRVGGRHVAAVCSKRCGLELIGPDVAVDGVAEAQRFADMAKTVDNLRALAEIRANVFEMDPIDISTYTMPIGHRLEQDGVGIAKRLDEAIADARNTLQQMVDKRPYDMGRIDVLMARLRDDIALDGLLDIYISTPKGQARKLSGASESELLMESSSIFTEIAKFVVDNEKTRFIVESNDGRYLNIDDLIYQTNGKPFNRGGKIFPEFGAMRSQKSAGVLLDSVVGDWNLVETLSDRRVRLVDSAGHSYTKPHKFCFVSQGVHAAIFYRERQLSGDKYIRYARMESGVPVLKAIIPVNVTSPLIDKITIDVNGNVWVIDNNGCLHVYDANCVELSKMPDHGGYMLTPHRWGGVWSMSLEPDENWCQCFALIKQRDREHPMDIGSGRQYELIGPKRGADDDAAAERDAARQQLLNQRQEAKKRFTDMAKLAKALLQLIKLRARPRGMSNAYVATATLKIGRRLASGDAGVDDGIDTIIAGALAVVDDMIDQKPYNASFVQDAMVKFRDALAADAALDAFDATPAGQSDLVRRMNDDERQLLAYRVNPLEKYLQFDAINPFMFVIDLGDGRIVTFEDRLYNSNIYRDGKFIGGRIDVAQYDNLYAKNTIFQPNSSFLSIASNSYNLRSDIGGGDSRRRIICTVGQYLLHAYLPFTEPAWEKAEGVRSVQSIECRVHFVANPSASSVTLLASFSATGHTFLYNYASFAIDERGFVYARCASPDGSLYIVVYDKAGKQITTITEPTGTIFSISPSIGGILVGILSSGSKYSIAKYRFAPDSAYYAGMKELLLPTPTAPSAAAAAAV